MTNTLEKECSELKKNALAHYTISEDRKEIVLINDNDQNVIRTLKASSYSAVEKSFLLNFKLISSWPKLKVTPTRTRIKIFDSIPDMKSKSDNPADSQKRLALEVINSDQFVARNKFYTDGSLAEENRKGIGIHGPNCETSLRLSLVHSIMSIETNAIKWLCEYLWEHRIFHNIIFTDARSAAIVLAAASKEQECESILHEILHLLEKTDTTVQWIPAHCGIKGNEAADNLAKLGTSVSAPIYKKEMKMIKDAKADIKNETLRNWQNWYDDCVSNKAKGVKAAAIFKQMTTKHWIDEEKFAGEELKLLNRLVSGHDRSPAARYLKTNESDECDKCRKLNSATHMIFKCKKYTNRTIESNKNIIEWLKNANTNDVKEVIKFIKNNKFDL